MPLPDEFEEHHRVLGHEGRESGDHLEDNAAYRPEVDRLAMAQFADYLGSQVLRGAADAEGLGYRTQRVPWFLK